MLAIIVFNRESRASQDTCDCYTNVQTTKRVSSLSICETVSPEKSKTLRQNGCEQVNCFAQ